VLNIKTRSLEITSGSGGTNLLTNTAPADAWNVAENTGVETVVNWEAGNSDTKLFSFNKDGRKCIKAALAESATERKISLYQSNIKFVNAKSYTLTGDIYIAGNGEAWPGNSYTIEIIKIKEGQIESYAEKEVFGKEMMTN
jgi:hypothetical protein